MFTGRLGLSGWGRRGRHQEVANQHQAQRQGRPGGKGPAVVSHPPHNEDHQEGKPKVEKRQAPREERERRVEHIRRHARDVPADESSQKIGAPQGLREKDADGGHRRPQRVFGPQRDERHQQGHVAEIEEVRGPIGVQIIRNEHREKRRIDELQPQREPASAGCVGPVRSRRPVREDDRVGRLACALRRPRLTPGGCPSG